MLPLVARILTDRRHGGQIRYKAGPIAARRFADWNCAEHRGLGDAVGWRRGGGGSPPDAADRRHCRKGRRGRDAGPPSRLTRSPSPLTLDPRTALNGGICGAGCGAQRGSRSARARAHERGPADHSQRRASDQRLDRWFAPPLSASPVIRSSACA